VDRLIVLLDLVVGLPVLVVHLVAVAITHALRSYSASRLEDLTDRHGRPDRATRVQQIDEQTERATELLAVLTGLFLATFLGAMLGRSAQGHALDYFIAASLAFCTICHVVAGAIGRVHAETLIDSLWPIAEFIRVALSPLTFLTKKLEAILYGHTSNGSSASPRPPSVEVELNPGSRSEPALVDTELPDSTRAMLSSAIELASRDVANVMTPRASMVAMPASITVHDAARTFIETGLSRIPLYGEHRDDIVGILYGKDLLPFLVEAAGASNIPVRKLARPPLFVPETKNATELLDELRHQRVQMAIVLDEYGSVAGLVTLEDLLEHIVGPIDDEHDLQPRRKPIVHLGGPLYEIDGSVALEELNEALGFNLPTDGDFQTIGGLAQGSLGRIPSNGAHFEAGGGQFTVLEMADHSVRRLLVRIASATEPAARH
jgi:CBS domain containing-hemolysin-like protein